MVGYSQKWTREIVRRYESEGLEGLGDRRHANPGGAKERALLDEEGQARLREALLKAKGGCSAGRRDVERAKGGALDRGGNWDGKSTCPA